MVVVVSVIYHLVNDVLTSAIMALATGRPLMYFIRTNGRSTILAEAGAGMIGVLFALIWVVEPLWTTLLAIPGAVIARALQYIRQLERETRSAVASLAQVVDAVAIAEELDLDQELIELIEQAASVHDLGKIGIPDRVLLKPSPLTRDEQMTMWLHTEIGARILSQFNLFRTGSEIVLHHHEAYDGTGYPAGLAGEAIPLGARVIAVADALDAMTSDRPYRRALSIDEAVERFRAGSGRQWDPAIVQAMLGLVLDGRLRLDQPATADRSVQVPVDRRAIDMSSAHDEPPALDPSTIPPLDDDDRRDAA
jgi:HD-GYP domain-containing protein (c-di-GMP phosphodiesterase class II)